MDVEKDRLTDNQLKAVNGGTCDEYLKEAAKNAEEQRQKNLQNQINNLEEHYRERTSNELKDLSDNILDMVEKISDPRN